MYGLGPERIHHVSLVPIYMLLQNSSSLIHTCYRIEVVLEHIIQNGLTIFIFASLNLIVSIGMESVTQHLQSIYFNR